jgi:DNA-binding SARP family transcriptional activator
MEFRILGPLEVISDGKSLDLGGAKQRALLAMLLLNPNQVVSRDRLIDALWEENPPDTAPKALQVHVSRLRRQLGGDRIATKAPGYAIRVEPDELDAERFERLAEEGDRTRLVEALALWRGPPLDDVAHTRFARQEIGRLEERRLMVLEERIEADLALGCHTESIAELESLVAEQPLRERLRALSMVALYRSGRQAEALAVYQEARRTLVDELGIEPGRELRELHQRMLNQDPALDVHGGAAEAAATPAENTAIGDRLRMLSGECRRVLSLASVLGQEFGLVALERVADYTGIDRLLRVLGEAIDARIVEQVPGSLGLLRFVHALERETLYGEIPAAHRARLHRRVAEVLEALYAVDPEPHHAEVAFHRALAEQG